MVKRDEAPEDFTKSEDKFRLSLFNMEKRFVDLEFMVSDLSERLRTGQAESIKELAQHVEDVEDLILVEQAGLMELKKAMEGAEGKFQTAIEFDEGLENRVKDGVQGKLGEVENRIDTKLGRRLEDTERRLTGRIGSVEELAKKAVRKTEEPAKIGEEAKQRIALIEREIAEIKTRPPIESVSPLEVGELRNKLQNMEKGLSLLESTVGNLKAVVDIRIKESVEEAVKNATGQGVDFEFVKSRLDSLKAGVDTLSDKRAEADFKMSELEEKVNGLSTRVREAPAKIFDELKETRSGLETAKIRIESLERVVREVTAGLNEIENKAKSFESLERLTNLKKEVDEKLRSFKFVEEEIGRLSSRVEIMYNDLDKRLMSIRGYEKDIKRLSDSMTDFVKDLEQVRIDMKARVERKDVGKIVQAVEENKAYVNEIVDSVKEEVERLRGEIQQRIEKKEVGSIVGKVLSGVEERIKHVESGGDMDAVMGEMEVVKKRLNEVEELKENLIELIKNLKEARKEEKEELPEGFKVIVSDIGTRMSGIEKSFEMMHSYVNELSQRMQEPVYDARMKELVEKFIFLESRLIALESMLQKTQPIILE